MFQQQQNLGQKVWPIKCISAPSDFGYPFKGSGSVVVVVVSLFVAPIVCMGFLFGPCIDINAFLSGLSSFAVILLMKSELVVLHLLSSCCHVAIGALCYFLMITWVGLQCVTVALPSHAHILFLVGKYCMLSGFYLAQNSG